MKAKLVSAPLAALTAIVLCLHGLDSHASSRGIGAGGQQESSEVTKQGKTSLPVGLSLSGASEPGQVAMAALLMGDRYKQAREYPAALDYYRKALAAENISGVVKASALTGIATVYAELYLEDLAVSYFTDALAEANVARDLATQTHALMGLADLSLRQGASQKALDYITLALSANEKARSAPDPALSYLLGRVRQEQRAMPQAQAAFKEALALYTKAHDPVGQVRVLCALSDLSLLDSQKQAALKQAEQATDLADKQTHLAVTEADHVNAYDLRWPAWLSRARAERALGITERALNSYHTATSCIAAAWWGIYLVTEASAMAFREVTQPAYREYIDLLIRQGQFTEAFRLADEAKARVALNLITVRQQARQSGDGLLPASQREPSPSISLLRLRLAAAGRRRAQQAKLKQEIADAERKARELQVEAEMRSAARRRRLKGLSTSDELQKLTAADHMALAEFSLGETQSAIWLFANGKAFFARLPARSEIEDQVRAYLNAVSETPNHLHVERDIPRLRKQAATLFSLLFGQLSEKLEPGQRLVIVPDGLLHYLPFEALIHNERYLVEDHEISYDPSASILGLWIGTDTEDRRDGQRELFAVGDPVYEWPAANGAKADLSPLARQMLKARDLSLSSLPRTRDEVQDIAALFPASRSTVLLGKESTEEAVKRAPLSLYRRLHFAAHSLINEKAPLRSAVVLTPGDDAQDDGMLDVGEIARLNLDSDLVVVSACQTGRGQLLSGEGIVGISRAFLEAGSRAVVVSLWNVNDTTTGQLMKDFYQQLTRGNAAALRLAKLRMLNGRQTRHPYYWATFVMIGKP